MKPKTRTDIRRLAHGTRLGDVWLRRMARDLRSESRNLPAEFADIHSAIACCESSIQNLFAKLEAAYEANEKLCDYWWNESLTEADIQQLLALNRLLRDVGPFLRSVADDIRPRLESKLADPSDPLYDYEIEAHIDFILREDDSEYDEADDNILTTRNECLKDPRGHTCDDCAEPIGPDGLRTEPHCWLFHDLYDHDYGEESPRLSFRDCLRIGKILIDVQVWQQYCVDVAAEDSLDL